MLNAKWGRRWSASGATVFFLVVDFSCFVGFWRLEVVEEKKVATGAFSLGEGRPH
jgi:hypothetical protein